MCAIHFRRVVAPSNARDLVEALEHLPARAARRPPPRRRGRARSLRAGAAPWQQRGERAREPLARRAAGDRADEVLARDRQQERAPSACSALERAQHLDASAAGVLAKSGPGSTRSARGSRHARPRAPCARAGTPRRRRRRRRRSARSRALLGLGARVHHDERRSRSAAADVGEPGSRRPLTSLRIAAPAATAAAATAASRCRRRRARPRRRAARRAGRRARSHVGRRSTGGYVTPDSPPTSMRSAPSATSAQRVRDLALERVDGRASENESGLALTIPMTSGRPRSKVSVRSRARRLGKVSGRRAHAAGRVAQEQVVLGAQHLAQVHAHRRIEDGAAEDGGPVARRRAAGASVSTRSSTRPSAKSPRSSVGPPSVTTSRAPCSARRWSRQARAPSAPGAGSRHGDVGAQRRQLRPALREDLDARARLAEQRHIRQARVERTRDRRHERLARQAALEPALLLRRVEDRRVALGDQRPGPDEQGVRGRPQLAQHVAVGRAAEPAGAACRPSRGRRASRSSPPRRAVARRGLDVP